MARVSNFYPRTILINKFRKPIKFPLNFLHIKIEWRNNRIETYFSTPREVWKTTKIPLLKNILENIRILKQWMWKIMENFPFTRKTFKTKFPLKNFHISTMFSWWIGKEKFIAFLDFPSVLNKLFVAQEGFSFRSRSEKILRKI